MKKDVEEEALDWVMVVCLIAFVLALFISATSCVCAQTESGSRTLDAVQALPADYWMATENLAWSALCDLWSLISWIF